VPAWLPVCSADNVGHAFRAPRLTAPHQRHLQVASRRLYTVNNYCKGKGTLFDTTPYSNEDCRRRGTWVWTTCPESLRSRGLTGNRTRDLLIVKVRRPTVASATTPPVRLNNYCKLDAVFSLLPSNASCGVFKSHELSTASRFTALESSENMRSPRSYGIYINVTKTQFGESSNCQIGLNRHSFHFVTSLSFRYAIRSIELHQRW